MGSAVSILPENENSVVSMLIKEVPLRQLPDAIEEAIYIHEKFPLIIDPTEQAARLVSFVNLQFTRMRYLQTYQVF